jgi:hypothetical protein
MKIAAITDRVSPRFNIEVTDERLAHGPGISQHVSFSNWRRIGRLNFR